MGLGLSSVMEPPNVEFCWWIVQEKPYKIDRWTSRENHLEVKSIALTIKIYCRSCLLSLSSVIDLSASIIQGFSAIHQLHF